MLLTSVKTRGNFSPARNVLSTTAPESMLLIFVRTNAPPFPGLTCWNSRMRQTEPSSSTCIPFLNSLVETTSATPGQSTEPPARAPTGTRPHAARQLQEPAGDVLVCDRVVRRSGETRRLSFVL